MGMLAGKGHFTSAISGWQTINSGQNCVPRAWVDFAGWAGELHRRKVVKKAKHSERRKREAGNSTYKRTALFVRHSIKNNWMHFLIMKAALIS